MPLYEYQCECGKVTEDLQPSTVETIPCACGGRAKRIMSASACKVWWYEPWRMDAEADCRRCGVDYDG